MSQNQVTRSTYFIRVIKFARHTTNFIQTVSCGASRFPMLCQNTHCYRWVSFALFVCASWVLHCIHLSPGRQMFPVPSAFPPGVEMSCFARAVDSGCLGHGSCHYARPLSLWPCWHCHVSASSLLGMLLSALPSLVLVPLVAVPLPLVVLPLLQCCLCG